MFDITDDDIVALDDADLRLLVGRLCEAELRRHGHSPSAVTYGGNHTAKDGGIDVRVSLSGSVDISGFIPRPQTGFQVKKPDMPPYAITEEMRPKPERTLRETIANLARAGGAYVIVSATGSTADSALADRQDAMQQAVSDLPESEALTLQFYDRTRVATWVRDHPGLIPWVRARIGRMIQGWQPYGNWSRVPQGVERSYLADATTRVYTGRHGEEDGIGAIAAIDRIREILRTPGGSVRLVGLSGTGKTRFAEALFEESIGSAEPLNSMVAFYTDLADGPQPPPWIVAADLIAQRRPGILVVDNCPADTHRQIADVVRSDGTTASVITIEYDIRDDQPEGTEAFRLDTSSTSLIEQLVRRHNPMLSQVDAETIADFSGGNARVALAVGSTVGKNDSLAGLNDEALFLRLFQQRNQPDGALLAAAEACALVYSFDAETADGPSAELPVLARLADATVDQAYRVVSELLSRGLVQARAQWRAVLPPAIAHRLAARALKNTHPATLTSHLVDSAPPRLLKSFARRLGYLHNSIEAQSIARTWLAAGGLLGDVATLDAEHRTMFMHVAPMLPDLTLARLEAALANLDDQGLQSCRDYVPILRSVAYEDGYFARAVSLLIRFARAEATGFTPPNRTSVVEPLFYITLSGTHAALSTRLQVIDRLFNDSDPFLTRLGGQLLGAALKSDYFSSAAKFDFGARSRDHGYHPPSGKAVADWFAQVLAFATPIALGDDDVKADLVLKAIGQEFRGLWINGGQSDALEALARSLHDRRFWREGWSAARQTLLYDGPGLPGNVRDRLVAVADLLTPNDLVNRVRGFVISPKGTWDVDDLHRQSADDFESASATAAATASALGEATASEPTILAHLLPELVQGTGGRIADFGFGLATVTDTPRECWAEIVQQMDTTPPNNVQLLYGFLQGLHRRDAALANALLDDALRTPSLVKWIPWLQTSLGLDSLGLARLHLAIKQGASPAEYFSILSGGRVCDAVPGEDFRDLILAIAEMPGGIAVALDILGMRLFTDKSDEREPALEVVQASKQLLMSYTFQDRSQLNQGEDDDLGRLVDASLTGDDGRSIAGRLIRELAAAVAAHQASAFQYTQLVSALLRTQPHAVLDELFSGAHEHQRIGVRLLRELRVVRRDAMASVPDDTIISWCDADAATRYPLAAAVAVVLRRPHEGGAEEWAPLTRRLLLGAPDPRAVLNEILDRMWPNSWSGSLASILEARLDLLERLEIADFPVLAEAFEAGRAALRRSVESQRAQETEEGRSRPSSFE